MRRRLIVLGALLPVATALLFSQITITPSEPTVNDTVTVVYDATQGNGELAGISPIYAHTGVLTLDSQHPSDWKHVKTNWGENTEEVRMTDLGNNKNQLRYHIKSYYGIPDEEVVTDLAFVFRDASASTVGRNAENGDIFYPVQVSTSTDSYQSHTLEGNLLTLETLDHTYSIRAYSEDIVRIGFYPGNIPVPDPTDVVTLPPGNSGTVTDRTDQLSYRTASTEILVNKDPFGFTFIRENDTLLHQQNGFQALGKHTLVPFTTTGESAFHGTGFRAVDLNLDDLQLKMYNQPRYGYGPDTKNLNIAIPFLVSTEPYGLYFDHRYPSELDLASSDTGFTYTLENGNLALYYIGADNMESLLERYTGLTGTAPLPPRWALGYIQSRYGYETESQAREVVSRMQEENFPIDALVLDLYWFGSPSTMGNLAWDYSRFPEPGEMIDDFSNKGVKTILITEPYVTTSSSNYQAVVDNELVGNTEQNEPYILNGFWAGSSVLLDLFREETRSWMWDFYQARINEGVAGWWCDLGEPEDHPSDMMHGEIPARELHNHFSWRWAKMLHDRYHTNYPDQRLFNLIRSGYAGMQRWGALPWSGDIQRSWGGMQVQVPIMLNMGYSGVGYMHSDLGGFTGGSQDNELYTRWLQLGAFSPVMRAHGTGVPTEPIYYPDPYKSIVRSFIELRYRLLPYNYTLAFENAATGIPLARAMNFYDPGNSTLHAINDQFYWGKDMLIAPVLQQGATSRQVHFPEGNWIHYFNGKRYSGNNTATIDAPLSSMPVFVRAGSLIPHTDLFSSTDEYNGNPLSVYYYPDESSPETSFTLFNDDGKDPESLDNNAFEEIFFSASYDPDSTVITVHHSGSFPAMPQYRNLEFRVKRITGQPEVITINNNPVPVRSSHEEYEMNTQATWYDENNNELYVQTTWNNEPLKVVIKSLFTGNLPVSKSSHTLSLDVFPGMTKQSVTLSYTIPSEGVYRLDAIQVTGNLRKHLFTRTLTPGMYTKTWNTGESLSPGIYLLRLSGRQQQAVKRLIILR